MAAQETLVMLLTRAGTTTSVGSPQDTLQSWIMTKAWDLDKADCAKFLERIIVHLTRRMTQVNMYLEIYGSDAEDDEDKPFVLLQKMPLFTKEPLCPNISAFRYFKFRFSDEGVRERWRLSGFEIFGEFLGDEF